MTTFGTLLRQYREAMPGYTQATRFGPAQQCLSQNALAQIVDCDPAYINRLERGLSTNPSRIAVLAFAEAFSLNASQTDRLLFAAGLAPETDYQALWERYCPAVERLKWCWKCQFSLPLDRFSRDRTRYDGLLERCKDCDAAQRKMHRTRVALRGARRTA